MPLPSDAQPDSASAHSRRHAIQTASGDTVEIDDEQQQVLEALANGASTEELIKVLEPIRGDFVGEGAVRHCLRGLANLLGTSSRPHMVALAVEGKTVQVKQRPRLGRLLTDRELYVLEGFCSGRSRKALALELGLSVEMIKLSMGHLRNKFSATSPSHLAALAVESDVLLRPGHHGMTPHELEFGGPPECRWSFRLSLWSYVDARLRADSAKVPRDVRHEATLAQLFESNNTIYQTAALVSWGRISAPHQRTKIALRPIERWCMHVQVSERDPTPHLRSRGINAIAGTVILDTAAERMGLPPGHPELTVVVAQLSGLLGPSTSNYPLHPSPEIATAFRSSRTAPLSLRTHRAQRLTGLALDGL